MFQEKLATYTPKKQEEQTEEQKRIKEAILQVRACSFLRKTLSNESQVSSSTEVENVQGYSEAPDGSETESGEDDGDGGGGLTANNNAASIQQEQVVCDGSDSVILSHRPSIERSRRLLPSQRRTRTSRIGGALCILPIIKYLFYNLHNIQGKPEEPGRGKEKESSGQGSKGGKKSLDLNEDFPTFPT